MTDKGWRPRWACIECRQRMKKTLDEGAKNRKIGFGYLRQESKEGG